ncbi:MAG: hypothetical protein HY553_13120 [Elusimicrobia bacterium]|nr:hypothetical protein [Elusimicrobiota bacterium]
MRQWLLLGLLGATGALYFSAVEPEKGVDLLTPGAGTLELAQTDEPPAMTADDHVLAALPMLERPDMSTRLSVIEVLDGVVRGELGKELSPEAREQAAKALVAAFQSAPEDGPEGLEFKRHAVRLTIAHLASDASRDFAVELLSSTTDSWKREALQAWLSPGAVNGQAIRAKAAELAKTDVVPDAKKPAVIRRALGKKAEGELITLLDTELGRQGLSACVVELQNLGKPELMGRILSRLEEAGMLGDHRKLPWMSGRLLSEHIRVADGADLKRALKVVYLRPRLARATAKAVKERAGHPDATVRRMVARIIPDAVKNEGIDIASGEELLLAQLKEETDPAVKGEIEGSLAEVRKTRPAPEATPATPTEP